MFSGRVPLDFALDHGGGPAAGSAQGGLNCAVRALAILTRPTDDAPAEWYERVRLRAELTIGRRGVERTGMRMEAFVAIAKSLGLAALAEGDGCGDLNEAYARFGDCVAVFSVRRGRRRDTHAAALVRGSLRDSWDSRGLDGSRWRRELPQAILVVGSPGTARAAAKRDREAALT